jgi:hypothetical protein
MRRMAWCFITLAGIMLVFNSFGNSPFETNRIGDQIFERSSATITPALICTGTNLKTWSSVSGLCHLMMFYGFGKTDLPDFPSGDSMFRALTDEEVAIRTFGKSPFIKTRNGLRYFLSKDPIFNADVGEAHRDQCLATFAELKLPLETPIQLKSGKYTIADLLSEALANFDLDEKEPAWTAIAFVTYLPPRKDWVNRFQERTTFSRLVQSLLRVNLDGQSCAGTHILEALGLIAKADSLHPILDTRAREVLHGFLISKLREVVERQQPDGSWNHAWCSAIKNDDSGSTPALEFQMLVTGHLVGILREVDSSGIVPRSSYERAADWLQIALRSTDVPKSAAWLCPVTHAAVAIREVNTINQKQKQ